MTVTKQNDKILNHIRPSKQQSVSAPPIPAALYHVLVFPAETRLRVPLFFTMATSYPNGNEGVLHNVTRINLSSTVTVSKGQVNPELVFNSNLVNCEMVDVRVRDQPVHHSVPAAASCRLQQRLA